MRNLKLLYSRHKPPSPDLADCYHISVDPDSGNVILVTASRILALDPLASQVTHSRSLFCEELLQEGKGHIVNMHYLPEQHSACLATSKGNIVLWSLDVDELECMGSVESGFTNMNWSPDNELLVLTTGGNTVIIMTREFDPVTEMPLHPSEFGEGEFIALGWGKKETQFHGSEGKHAARRQKEDIQPAVTWDDQKPRICWRGDGQFFAVSCISPSSGARTIRVWSREGLLQSTSEPMSGLEQALFWRPSGSLITSSQRKPNKHNVVFFEKNGLQHGEFTLPFQVQEVQVMEIMWNIESTILAVWCEDLPPQGLVDKDSFKPQSHVLLWTCSNYHWAQKQSLIFGGSHGKVSAMTWDPEQAGRLHLMTSDGEYLQYTWTWSTNHSLGQTLHDSANVFVINGKTVCITPMRQMVIPPPMSAYQLQLPSPVNMVVSPALPANATNAIAILTHDNQLFVYMPDVKKTSDDKEMTHSQGDGPQCTEPVLQTSYQVVLPDGVSEFPLCINHICWPQSDTLIFSIQNDKGALLCPSHLPSQTTPNILLLGTLIPVEDMVISLSTSIYSRSVAIQLANGVMLRYRFDDETLLPWETALGKELHMPYPCSQIEIVSFCGEEAVLGLTERFRFYVNGIEIASNCTSFAVHNNFVLLTTLNHTVRCIHRHTTVQDLPSLSDGKAHPFDESIRRVERGSRIVTVVAEDTKLVLQMPRGNLETIHPRALVLTTVRKFLDRCEFGSAFTIMKKHRINLNLLYDHNPLMFLRSVTDFIHQISSVTDLNLFLMELQEEDVTVIMYTAVYNRTPDAPASTTISDKHASKVDTVCDAVRSALEQEGVHRYLLSILTTYVKKSVPDLRKALEIVWEVKGSGMEEGGVGADEALKYLLLLVDVNRLYDAALATYNFDLVLMVAEKSQKDPKEYLPFLNQLRKLPDYYCRFTIDRHLKLYSSALKHISYCGPDHFSECIDLVQEHKLYAEALKLYATDSLEFKTLAREYGYYLREKNRHEEAGIAFLRAEYRRQAFDTFIECLNWRQAFCMTEQLQLDPSFIADTARKLAVRLKDNKRFSEAAIVYEHYAKDVEEAIVALIEGALWDEALRLMHLHQRTDIIETHLKTAINEACDQTMAMLENQHWEMEKHIKRLMDVRQEKEHRQQELWDQRDNINAELLSDTSSMTGESTAASHVTVDSNRSTVFSKAFGRSGRNRRKADHKRWSLKEGSPYEECALMDAIAKIISTTDGMREEVYALLRVLVQFHHIEQAEELQERYDNFLITIQRVIPQVWVLDNSEDNNTVLGPGMTANAIAQAMRKGQMPASVNRLDPVLSIPPVLKKNVRWKLHMLNTSEHKKL